MKSSFARRGDFPRWKNTTGTRAPSRRLPGDFGPSGSRPDCRSPIRSGTAATRECRKGVRGCRLGIEPPLARPHSLSHSSCFHPSRRGCRRASISVCPQSHHRLLSRFSMRSTENSRHCVLLGNPGKGKGELADNNLRTGDRDRDPFSRTMVLRHGYSPALSFPKSITRGFLKGRGKPPIENGTG